MVMSKKRSPHIGNSLDDLLKEEGFFEEVQVPAIEEAAARQLEEVMKERQVSKARLAKLPHVSRTQVNRLLDPKSDVSLFGWLRGEGLLGTNRSHGFRGLHAATSSEYERPKRWSALGMDIGCAGFIRHLIALLGGDFHRVVSDRGWSKGDDVAYKLLN